MLDDDVITLRALEQSDLLTIHRWENLSALWRSGSTLAPYSVSNVAAYLRSYNADPFAAGELRLMIELKQEAKAVGFVELYEVEVRHRRANVGILIDPDYARRHLGQRALRVLCRYCFMHLGLRQLLAYVPEDNAPSIGLFEKGGFSRVATLPEWLSADGGWIDVLILRCKNND